MTEKRYFLKINVIVCFSEKWRGIVFGFMLRSFQVKKVFTMKNAERFGKSFKVLRSL